jgi:hypothetical protein
VAVPKVAVFGDEHPVLGVSRFGDQSVPAPVALWEVERVHRIVPGGDERSR